jgi:preprotein translocase subunit SecA
MNEVAPLLKRQESEEAEGDFFVDEKGHTILLSEQGHEHAEQILSRLGLLQYAAAVLPQPIWQAYEELAIQTCGAMIRAHVVRGRSISTVTAHIDAAIREGRRCSG